MPARPLLPADRARHEAITTDRRLRIGQDLGDDPVL